MKVLGNWGGLHKKTDAVENRKRKGSSERPGRREKEKN